MVEDVNCHGVSEEEARASGATFGMDASEQA
jgi:hypothetical protein